MPKEFYCSFIESTLVWVQSEVVVTQSLEYCRECHVMLLLIFSVNQNVVTDVDDSRNAVDDFGVSCSGISLQQRMSRS